MVIGSRFINGAGIEEKWSYFRRFNAFIARCLAKPLVPNLMDPMSGFFALKRSDFMKIGFLNPIGYKIGLEIIVKGNLKVSEVPIFFKDRKYGKSKLNLTVQIKFIKHLCRLYTYKLRTGL